MASYTFSSEELEELRASISHDLTAPVRHIEQFADLLLDPEISSSDKDEFLGFIKTCAATMRLKSKALSHYIHLSDVRFERSNIDIVQCCNSVLEKFDDQIQKFGVSVELPHQGIVLNSNFPLLHELFGHIIENAIKFRSEERDLVIQIQSEQNLENVIITISDNGMGIPTQFKDVVFDAFRTLHLPETYSGIGMGLTYCRKIADILGGSISIAPVTETGTCIELLLPLSANSDSSGLTT